MMAVPMHDLACRSRVAAPVRRSRPIVTVGDVAPRAWGSRRVALPMTMLRIGSIVVHEPGARAPGSCSPFCSM
jgi:hypothetical protein